MIANEYLTYAQTRLGGFSFICYPQVVSYTHHYVWVIIMLVTIKQGDTFAIQGAITDNGSPVDISLWQIKCQIRKNDRLIADLSVDKVNAAGGIYQLKCLDTTDWPITIVEADIRYVTPSNQIISTETFDIDVKKPVTQGI